MDGILCSAFVTLFRRQMNEKAIGVRLEEILIDDALCGEDFDMHNIDEQRQRMLIEEDENEDFLVEGSFSHSFFFLSYSFPSF